MSKPKVDYKTRVLDSLPCMRRSIVSACGESEKTANFIIKEMIEEDLIYKDGIIWKKVTDHERQLYLGFADFHRISINEAVSIISKIGCKDILSRIEGVNHV